MEVAFLGFDLAEGKFKYQDQRFIELVQKFEPQKETPFFVELAREDFSGSDANLVSKSKALDFLISDMEQLENRLANSTDEKEKILLKRCLESLEKETPLCDLIFAEEELTVLRSLAPHSLKPTIFEDESAAINELLEKLLAKAGMVFFYTCGKKEVHAWAFTKGSDIVICAGKIHSDLARGFIRAEIVNYRDLIQVHNMQEAKDKGLVKLVGKDYITQDGDIIEIKFNV